jgi:prophage maintenance system killer protein
VNKKSDMVIYVSKDRGVELNIALDKETVWLSQKQMSQLFHKDVRTISEHIKNIFKEGELAESSVIRKSRITASDQKSYEILEYNLDVIISVGYRVKSKEGTLFRIWSTKVLRDHLIKGYSLNHRLLAEKGMKELEQSMVLMQKTLLQRDLVSDLGKSAIKIVTEYAKSWRLLLAYDEEQLSIPKSAITEHKELSYKNALNAVSTLKQSLISKNEASSLFGNEIAHGLQGILGNIEQTFDGGPLYPSIEEKAAHLLYFIIKDHPFTDGNKRIGSLLFLCYLNLQEIELSLNENGIVALALLVAESNPNQKDLIVKLITNLIINTDELSC